MSVKCTTSWSGPHLTNADEGHASSHSSSSAVEKWWSTLPIPLPWSQFQTHPQDQPVELMLRPICFLPAEHTTGRNHFSPEPLSSGTAPPRPPPQNRMKVDYQRKNKKYRSVQLTVVSCEPHLETTQRSIGTREALKSNKTGLASCTCVMNIITFESISSFRIVDSFWVGRVVSLVQSLIFQFWNPSHGIHRERDLNISYHSLWGRV